MYIQFLIASQDGSVVKSLPASAGDGGPTPGSGRSPEEGNGNPLQHSCLAGHSPRGRKRVGRDLSVKPQQQKT